MRAAVFLLGAILAFAGGADAQRCLVPDDEIVSGGPGKDGIPALTTPKLVSAAEADSFLTGDDLVLGVVVEGEARAYPHAVFWWHEIVNDVLGGKPVLVTFCPLTGSGIAFDPGIDGSVRNFGVSGLLFDNNLILFDRTTDSLWSQMGARSICGGSRGTSLTLLPIVQSTWSFWKTLHPETTVVSFDTGFRRNYDVYPYGAYDQMRRPRDRGDEPGAPLKVKTSYLWTASDPTIAAVNGDDHLPDLAIGRLPPANLDEAPPAPFPSSFRFHLLGDPALRLR